MNNLEIVKNLYAAYAARDRQKILQIFDPHIEWIQNEGFPGGGRHIGADTVVNDVLKTLQKKWQGWQAVVEEWLDAGDTVIALGEYHGTYKVTGKSTKAAFAHVYRVKEGRIVKFQQYTDTFKIVEAMRPTPDTT